MKRPFELSVFIASPSDVATERELVERLCGKWTDSKGADREARLAVKRWEKHMPITSGESPQHLINSQLLGECDILVGIFWTRFGSNTDDYQSGTEEEVEEFLRQKKPVILYFLDKSAPPSSVDPDQLRKVQLFKERYKENNVYTMIGASDELELRFDRDISYNVDKVLKGYEVESAQRTVSTKGRTSIVESGRLNKGEEAWYELSIRDLIAQYLEEHNLAYVSYKREITFEENCALWRGLDNYAAVEETARKARENAFNTKYGYYNYNRDLREKYKNTWLEPITRRLAKLGDLSEKSLVGIGANDGRELHDILQVLQTKPQMEVLDMSDRAISRGREQFPSFGFHVGNMERSTLHNDHYDICLNLRSIHSSGVEMRAALAETHRILKPGGFAIISVSDGYLIPSKPEAANMMEVKGMYTRAGVFLKDKPYRVAEQIREKMDDYGFTMTGFTTGETELFIFGTK